VAFVLFLSATSLAASKKSPPPGPITVLFSFPCNSSGVCADGYFPASLLESPDGNFYGTAFVGGTGTNAQGTVFKFNPVTGQVSVIYSFAELGNGSLPYGVSPEKLVEGTDGFLYGTTLEAGGFGAGTVYKLSKSGMIQDLHDFCSTLGCPDGANPAFLMQALDGNLYGITAGQVPSSVLYRLSPTGTFAVLHTFDTKTQPDGTGGVFLQASDGNFYGTTSAGQQNNPYDSVFKFSPASGAYTILYGFNYPNVATSNLAQVPAGGELFGIQSNSILYRISEAGAYQQIGPLSSTQFWNAHIMLGSDGNLWGDFQGGDCSDQGMVFGATTSGVVLQNITFNCSTDGEQPASMFQAADGKFYGVTLGSGSASTNSTTNGTIWVIDLGLPPPAPVVVNFQPTSGGTGTSVLLQGQHFIGTTVVSFNGVNTSFQVLTANYISATVPSGATSGEISVTNGGGPAASAQVFTVK
jgi:uncharacterized repeat protein (TIGR03803 family)